MFQVWIYFGELGMFRTKVSFIISNGHVTFEVIAHVVPLWKFPFLKNKRLATIPFHCGPVVRLKVHRRMYIYTSIHENCCMCKKCSTCIFQQMDRIRIKLDSYSLIKTDVFTNHGNCFSTSEMSEMIPLSQTFLMERTIYCPNNIMNILSG